MSYILERFGTVTLPIYDPQIDVGTGGSAAATLNLPGGRVYDGLGGEQAARAATHIRLRGTLLGATPEELDAAYDDLRRWRGRRDQLWRRRADGSEQWCLARLLEVKATRQAQHWRHLEVDLEFLMLSPVWYGDSHGQPPEQPVILDVSPKTVTMHNGGNAPVANAVLTLTAQGGTITEVTIAVLGVSEMRWNGTLSVGQQLVIDCGARSVKKAGSDAYGGFSLTENHRIDDWLRLMPGDNPVEVELTGGGSTSTLQACYWDGWE
jgi:hypothetical protein